MIPSLLLDIWHHRPWKPSHQLAGLHHTEHGSAAHAPVHNLHDMCTLSATSRADIVRCDLTYQLQADTGELPDLASLLGTVLENMAAGPAVQAGPNPSIGKQRIQVSRRLKGYKAVVSEGQDLRAIGLSVFH